MPVSDHSSVRFGLSGGGSWNTVDMDKLNAINDPALGTVLDQNASLSGNAGVSFQHRFFNFGASLPAIFSPVYVSEDAFNMKEVKPFQALILHASNRFYFNDNKNIFEPYALYYVNTGLPAQFEVAGILHLNHVVWAGVSYKQYFGPTALGGIKLKNTLAIGASYSIQKSGPDELNSPSFEVSLNLLFGSRKRGVPVYSFVNAVRPKERNDRGAVAQAARVRQKQVEAAQKKKEEAALLQKEREDEKRAKQAAAQEKKAAEARAEAMRKAEADERRQVAQAKSVKSAQATEQQRKDLASQAEKNVAQQPPERTDIQEQQAVNEEEQQAVSVIPEQPEHQPLAEVPVQPQPSESRTPIEEGHPTHEQEQLQRLQAVADNPGLAEHPTTISDEVRHEFIKRGSHPDELPASDYVIAGVFKSAANAKHFSDGLRTLDYNSGVGYLTAKDLWYVYIFKSNNVEDARRQQARYARLFLLRDAWLLTVEP